MTVIFLCLVSFFISSLQLHKSLAPLIQQLNGFCLQSIPEDSWKLFDQALLCGSPIPNSNFKSLLIETSIYHIVVVSSAHLIFLKSTFETLLPKTLPQSLRSFFICVGLFVYSLMTSLEAPILRALGVLLLAALSKKLKLHWKPHQILLYSTILAIGINPNLINSISLQLSFLTGLGLAIELPPTQTTQKLVIRSLLLYLLLFPVLCLFMTPHPIGILINSFIAPLISFLILPLSFLSLLGTFLRSIYLSFLEGFFFFLKEMNPHYPSSGLSTPYPYQLMWAYCFCCWSIYAILFVIKKRRTE